MSGPRCDECWQPVSMRLDKQAQRVRLENGRWAHWACAQRLHADPSPGDVLLRGIFGTDDSNRRRVATDEMARAAGHVTRLVTNAGGTRWRCTCGLTGTATGGKAEVQEDARIHKRFAAVQSEPSH